MGNLDFYTEEHEMFRKALRKMLDKEAYPYFKQCEKDRDIPVAAIYAGTTEIMKGIIAKQILK